MGNSTPSLGNYAPRSRKPGRVYLIECPQARALKIGHTYRTAEQRRVELTATGTPGELAVVSDVLGSIRDEKAMHRRFDTFRIRGEWFRDVPEIRARFHYIASMQRRAAPPVDAPRVDRFRFELFAATYARHIWQSDAGCRSRARAAEAEARAAEVALEEAEAHAARIVAAARELVKWYRGEAVA